MTSSENRKIGPLGVPFGTKMADLPEFSEMQELIQAGMENLRKWYWKVDGSDAVFITLSE
jgi:hypothetical protein